MLLAVGCLALGGWTLGFAAYAGICTAATLVLSALLLVWLKKRGAARFAAL